MPTVLGERLTGRLVEMDVQPRADAGLGRVEQVAYPGLDEHGLEPRHLEQLLAAHPREAAVDLLRLRLLTQPVVRLDEADDLVVLAPTVDGQLARVCMANADLADLDAWRSSPSGPLLSPRQGPEERGGEEARGLPDQRASARSVHRFPRRPCRTRPGRDSRVIPLPRRTDSVGPFSLSQVSLRLSAGRGHGKMMSVSTGLDAVPDGHSVCSWLVSRQQTDDEAMLRLLGNPKRLCQGLTRRDLLHLGGLGAFGFTLADDLSLRPAMAGPATRGSGFGRARSCILIYKYGSPPQHETFDPKPEAPAEIQGELGAIPTSVPGVPIGEHLPRIAGSWTG